MSDTYLSRPAYRLHGGSSPTRSRFPTGEQEVVPLDTLAQTRPTDFVAGPIIPDSLAMMKRTQLPLGNGSAHKLVARNPEVTPVLKPSEEDPAVLRAEEERLRRRASRKKFDAWVEQKEEEEKREREEAQKKKEQAKNEELKEREKKRQADKAFLRWKEKKESQKQRKHLSQKGGMRGPVKVQEFIAAFRRLNLGDFDLLVKYRNLLNVLNTHGKVDAQGFGYIMAQCDVERKVELARNKVREEKELEAARVAEEKAAKKDKSKPNNKPPPPNPAEAAKLKAEASLMRIGTLILKAISPGRQAFGVALQSIDSVFKAMDTDGNGILDRKEFKEGIKRLDIGINATQTVELLKGFDVDGSGNIDLEEFEAFLIKCKASVDSDAPRHSSRKFDRAWQIFERLEYDVAECKYYFEDAMMNVLETRKHREKHSNGHVTLQDLRSRILYNHGNKPTAMSKMSLSMRKDIQKLFDDVFHILQKKSLATAATAAGTQVPRSRGVKRQEAKVSLDAVDEYLVMILERFYEKEEAHNMPDAEFKLREARFRNGKKVLKISNLKGISFNAVMRRLNSGLPQGEQDKDLFGQTLKRMDLGLSPVQVDELLKLWEWEGTVDCDQFIADLDHTQIRIEQEEKWKSHSLSRHVDDFLRTIHRDKVLDVVKALHMGLQYDQLHDLDENKQLDGSGSGGANDDGTSPTPLNYEHKEFDITWGPAGQEVPMPPRKGNNIYGTN